MKTDPELIKKQLESGYRVTWNTRRGMVCVFKYSKGEHKWLRISVHQRDARDAIRDALGASVLESLNGARAS